MTTLPGSPALRRVLIRSSLLCLGVAQHTWAADAQQLDRVDVEASRLSDAYLSDTAATATKSPASLQLTPMSIAVIPAQVLQDQGITSSGLTNSLAYLGVQTLGTREQADYTIFRGFLTSTTLWNGFRIEDATPGINYANGSVWMDNVDRLEVLKGPASILYGRAEPGGIVNVITRRPLGSLAGSLEAGVGSFGARWIGTDITGPVAHSTDVQYRLNVAQEDADAWFRHGRDYHSAGIAPVLAWQLSEDTELSLEGQFRRLEGSAGQPYMPIDPDSGEPLEMDPRDTLLPGNKSTFRQDRAMVSLDHRFASDWSLSWKAMLNKARSPDGLTSIVCGWCGGAGFNFPIEDGVLLTDLMVGASDSEQETRATMLDLTGKITLLSIEHQLLVGADYYNKHFDQLSGWDYAQSTDYFHPTQPAAVEKTDLWVLRNRETAVYVQDQMQLPGGWHLLLGGRYQSIDEDNSFNGDTLPYRKHVFLPRAGALWEVHPGLSFYYSFAENTGSSNGLDFEQKPIKPESSRQHELGLKALWLDDRVSATVALFDLTKYNIASADPDHFGFNVGVGEVRSKGYEFGLQGAINAHWQVLFNHSHARPLVIVGSSGANALQPQSITAGEMLPFVSNRTTSLWTRYQFLPGGNLGWTVGGGIHTASAANPIEGALIPPEGYTVVSAFVSYGMRIGEHPSALQLNVNNLLDETYLLSVGDGGTIYGGNWGSAREVKLSLRVEF